MLEAGWRRGQIFKFRRLWRLGKQTARKYKMYVKEIWRYP